MQTRIRSESASLCWQEYVVCVLSDKECLTFCLITSTSSSPLKSLHSLLLAFPLSLRATGELTLLTPSSLIHTPSGLPANTPDSDYTKSSGLICCLEFFWRLRVLRILSLLSFPFIPFRLNASSPMLIFVTVEVLGVHGHVLSAVMAGYIFPQRWQRLKGRHGLCKVLWAAFEFLMSNFGNQLNLPYLIIAPFLVDYAFPSHCDISIASSTPNHVIKRSKKADRGPRYIFESL